MANETIPGQTIAFIVEPVKAGALPYMTYKPAVAEKRMAAGDIVTPYHSKRGEAPAAPAEDNEL